MKILFSIYIVLLSNFCFSQKLIAIKKTIHIEERYGIMKATFRETLPPDLKHRQSIIDIKFNPKAHEIYPEGGDLHALWDISKYDEGDSITINILLAIHKYDLETSHKKPSLVQSNIKLQKYLKDAKNLSIKNKNIQKVAAKLKMIEDVNTVKKTFHYVTDHLEYHMFEEQNRSAKKALKQGKGDCTEYSELMISLCRANDIPARIVSGYILKKNKTIGYHNWVEVYLSKNGWTPFDPTFSDAKKTNTTLSNLNNEYVYISNSRDHIHNFYEYKSYSDRTKYRLNLDVDAQWKDVTRIKRLELLSLYKEDDHQKTKELLDTLLIVAPDRNEYIRLMAITQARLKNFTESQKLLQNAWVNVENEKQKTSVIYAFSNYYALKGNTESALIYLEKAIDLGFDRKNHILKDKDLQSIQNHPKFIQIIDKIKE